MSAHPGKHAGDNELACPFCGSADYELFSLFGHTLLASQYYCRQCRSVFEAIRWQDSAIAPPPAADEETRR
jgi:hypothetical protein